MVESQPGRFRRLPVAAAVGSPYTGQDGEPRPDWAPHAIEAGQYSTRGRMLT